MRIIVPIKQVPETSAVKMDEKTGTMIRDGVEAIINPLDLYAIELAIRIKEKMGGEVTAVSMGPPKALGALKEAVAMGVDSAVLISDRAYAGADTWATSYVLAETIRKLPGADLIICGERATDGDTGQVGPEIASWLNLPLISYVGKVEYIDEKTCRVHRLVENGHELLEMKLPGVLTVVKEAADPRLPTLRGKKRAKSVSVPVYDQKSMQLAPQFCGLEGSPTRVVKIFRPKITRTCEIASTADAAGVPGSVDRLYAFLKQVNR